MTPEVSDASLQDDVGRMLGRLLRPRLEELAAQLRRVDLLSAEEQQVVHAAAAAGLTQTVWRRVSRVVLLELNAARVTGGLRAADPAERWQEWVERLATPGGWEAVAAPYPPLLPRLQTVMTNRCAAALRLARRFGQDRAALHPLLGGEPGQLRDLTLDAGDSHRGGQSVTMLRCTGGTVVYKPRSVRIDAVLGRLLPQLLPDEPPETRIRVPAVCPGTGTRPDAGSGDGDGDGDDFDEYGWAAYVPHRYCADAAQLRLFYRNLGHWLAVMRLLGGSDLHNENVVACGPVPVVVDCETLFTPLAGAGASGYGEAVDLASRQARQSLLRSGLLPGRGAMLGWRGVDTSAAGFLPGEQPNVQVPTIADPGTDRARLTLGSAALAPSANLPSPEPDLGRNWECVVDGFAELTERLHALDARGGLAPLLSGFADCPVRVVLRDTVAYAELGRMLWHPSSLHEPAPARQRAAQLLIRHADNRAGAPDDPAVVAAEIEELLDGDIPVFSTTPAAGQLHGPRGTRFGAPHDLFDETLKRWRAMDPAAERRVIQAAMVGAYLNDGWRTGGDPLPAIRVRTDALERRRRSLAARILRQLATHAVRGGDGSVTWVAPVRTPAGWAVQPLGTDLYGGTVGVAVLLAAYQHEVAAGRADPVPAATELLGGVIQTLAAADRQQEVLRAEARALDIALRPDPPGGYLGLGSRIWGWLLLHRLGAVPAGTALRRAEALAQLLPEAVTADREHDLLTGAAGAVVPLLGLAAHTGGDQPGRWRELAVEIGHRLRSVARLRGIGAGWPTAAYPEGIGGLSHGVTGIGWALARLAGVSQVAEFDTLADAAFAREESYYDRRRGAWRDIREAQRYGAGWCHGAVGIGIVAADLLRRNGDAAGWEEVLRRAVAFTAAEGFGWNHTLCHGDLGAWELLDQAWRLGLGPAQLRREQVSARILTSVEEHGAVTGMARDAFSPGLLAAEGGVAYQLLRLHPDSELPSVLLPDPAPPADARSPR